MDTTIKEAHDILRRRLAELSEETQRLEKALAALDDRNATKASPTPRRRRPRSSAKRAPRGAREKQLLAEIKKNPGAPVAAMARGIGVQPQQLYPLTKRLAADGKIERGETGWVPKAAAARKG